MFKKGDKVKIIQEKNKGNKGIIRMKLWKVPFIKIKDPPIYSVRSNIKGIDWDIKVRTREIKKIKR